MIREHFEPSGFFVMRTPVLPADEIRAWTEAAARGEDAEFVAERMRWPEVREALYLASPGLLERMEAARESGERDRGLERAVARYLVRMAGRSTPFGLFAGATVGRIGEADALQLPPRAEYARDTRLDMDYLSRLVESLQDADEVRERDRYVPNSSLYRTGEKLRYAEGRVSGQGRSYFLVSVEDDEALDRALQRAQGGATRAEIAEAIREEDIEEDEAREFVDELVAAQLLVSELEPPVTGPESLPALRENLAALALGNGVGSALEEVANGLRDMDTAGLGNDPARYRDLQSRLSALSVEPDPARLFQVDLRKPATDVTLDRRHTDAVLGAVDVLHDLFAMSEDGLEPFRREFQERYGDREVPLTLALDEERGIGFGSSPGGGGDQAPLLDGLPLRPPGADERVRWPAVAHLLLRRLSEALAAGEREIEIDPTETRELRNKGALPLADAVQVIATVLGPGNGSAADQARILLSGVGGPSGARMLGRFCHADPELCRLTAEHLRAEEALRPEAIFAEVVHLPEGRIGNILARPVLREYEIPFLGRSGVAVDHRIPVEDLHVSVRGGRVRLRSARLDREIVPRLTTAHNFSARSLGTYRFLGSLQSQGRCGGLGFSWAPFTSAPFLPRVRIGNVIVSRARWNLRRQDLEAVFAAGGPERLARFRELARTRRLPRYFGLVEGDNVLPVDLDNDALLDVLLGLIRKRPAFAIEELFLEESDLVVTGPEGRFAHELVIPFQRRQEPAASRPAARPAGSAATPAEPATTLPAGRQSVPGLARAHAAPGASATFPPGSDWLYFKAYGGPAGGDELLRGGFGDLAEQLVRDGLARDWFFIRYADPEPHLRIRFAGERARLCGLVEPIVLDALHRWLASGAGWRIRLDTYERETNRYGGPEGVAWCEHLFHADSHAVARLVALTAGDEGATDRWKLAAAGMDRLLSDLGFDDLAKWFVLKGLAAAFGGEFGITGDVQRAVMGRFRTERAALVSLLDPAAEGDEDLPERLRAGLRILADRSVQSATPAATLRSLGGTRRLERPLEDIAGSLLHMHANRMFRSSARSQEAVLYHFLEKIYDARLARGGIKARDRLAKLQERSG